MIPIECPKCGRGGSVPPDRLNARLVCKACHTVFHLDNTGRMVMGEPESFDMKTNKARAEVSSLADFDLSQTWKDIPAPVKYGVPAVLLGAIFWVNFGGGSSSPDYVSQAESIVRAVASNNRPKAISYGTTDSADATGQWFDLLHAEIEKAQLGSDIAVNPQLFSGNGEKDSEITLLVVITKNNSTDQPMTITMPMKKDGGVWKLEGNKGFESQKSASAPRKK